MKENERESRRNLRQICELEARISWNQWNWKAIKPWQLQLPGKLRPFDYKRKENEFKGLRTLEGKSEDLKRKDENRRRKNCGRFVEFFSFGDTNHWRDREPPHGRHCRFPLLRNDRVRRLFCVGRIRKSHERWMRMMSYRFCPQMSYVASYGWRRKLIKP